MPDRPASACLSRPPPFSRLCHRRAGFRRAFAYLSLARGELDPVSTCYSPMDEPSQTPPVDFCNRDDPRAQPQNRLNPARPTLGRPSARLTRAEPLRTLARSSRVTHLLSEADQPRFHRPGTGIAMRWARSSLGDRSPRKLYPDRIRSDTSCRRFAARKAWRACSARRRSAVSRIRPATDHLREPPPSRAASRAPPRRGARYAAPEVPSITEHPPEGTDPLAHKLSTTCGLLDLRLFIPRARRAS